MTATTDLIRRASVTDLPQVYEFELAYIREIEPQQEERWKAAISGLLRQWTTNLGRMWFAGSVGRLIGYCFWEPGKEAAVLSSIYVQPADRRHGWGRRLLARFEEDAVQSGHRKFSLGVQQANPARFLYEQCGYQLVKHVDDYRHYVKVATIGLRRHTVKVVEYRPEWDELFRAEENGLREALGDLVEDIQHVGSTAVPRLPAKPIIDVAIAVRSHGVIPELVAQLVIRGYIDRGESAGSGGHLLVKESEPSVRTFHLHIVERTDSQWRNYLAFRDALRQDDDLRTRYAALKCELATRFAGDRKSYTNAKHDFISEVLHNILEASRP